MERINDDVLENVAGGIRRIVNTKSACNAVVRKNPGTKYAIVRTFPNGRSVDVDEDSAVFNEEDGYTWYHIASPVNGWVTGYCIGLPEKNLLNA